ncbi:MAG: hypothetical protein RIB03_04150 [Henriciella sp.]|uniref:MotE family protein n=1 Tax=Henriciella sp. TaxID=1968823 RepID=UPI00260B845D|nr:hypothetical protein [Henriciella sp.]
MAGKNTRSNVLLTLGVLFTIGGASRILPHAFAAAEDTPPSQEEAAAGKAGLVPASYTLDEDADASAERVCFSGEAAAALAKDQAAFDERTAALQEEELSLQARRQELDSQAEELQALQKTLENRWRQMSASADQDIEHLAQMYAAMKPDQAAAIFNQMDPGFAAGFLRLMPSDQAGMILASMDASKAYVVSVKLASKNEDIRKAQK